MGNDKDRYRLPLNFDVQRMQDALLEFQPDEWIAHFVQENYQGDWSVIPLRGPADATHPVMMIYSDPACTLFADTPYLARTRYLPRVLDAFRCPLLAVRLMKLGPGSRILEHRDYDLGVEDGAARLHVPITLPDGVDFRLNGRSVPLQEGESWYLRLSDPHAVDNASDSERVHLVIDCEVNDWLLQQLAD